MRRTNNAIVRSCLQDIGRILADVTNGTAHLCEISCVGPKQEPNTFFYIFKLESCS